MLILERRWEEALRALKQAEDTITQHQQRVFRPLQLSDELKVASTDIGEHLPKLWKQLRREHQKALLRCLIDKVIVHRCKRDTLQLRIVWRGGETTSQKIPIPVGSFAELSGSKERLVSVSVSSRSPVTYSEMVFPSYRP